MISKKYIYKIRATAQFLVMLCYVVYFNINNNILIILINIIFIANLLNMDFTNYFIKCSVLDLEV